MINKIPQILIVDDIEENLQVLGNILNKEGYETSFALNGKQAISNVAENQPDLILLDVFMPIMDGFEVCKILKSNSETKEIPVIFLTAKTEIENMMKGFSLGGDDYVTKPFNKLELLARVRVHIELKKSKDLILEQNRKLQILVEELSITNTELKKLNASKDKFFSIIAHDLKGPVGNLNSFLNFMTDQLGKISMEDFQRNLLLLQSSSKKIKDLLDNLLTWARAQKGDILYNPDSYNIHKLVESNVLLFESTALNKNIKLENNVEENLSGFFDYEMIKTVLRNFISNSLKYTGEKGCITISAKESENYIEIAVADTGIGVSTEIAENLFRIDVKHFSTDGTAGEKGTGLGLILCKEFIEKGKGKIWVEKNIGTGSIFKFTIPKSK